MNLDQEIAVWLTAPLQELRVHLYGGTPHGLRRGLTVWRVDWRPIPESWSAIAYFFLPGKP
jgi:hypothetical protein